jgi:hypothetical protein
MPAKVAPVQMAIDKAEGVFGEPRSRQLLKAHPERHFLQVELISARTRHHPAPSPYAGAGRSSLPCVALDRPCHDFQ